MATINKTKLNEVMTGLAEGAPVTTARLKDRGISADLAVHYVRSGWLKRLARGVYQRAGDALQLHPTLRMLQAEVPGLHVGGKTALDWYGIRQYLAARPILRLYGWNTWRVPDWFSHEFPARYHRQRLFNERPEALLHVSTLNGAPENALVSEPERGFLEVLSDVGVRQPLSEARELAEFTHTLRPDVLLALLQACKSVKTVRLALLLGREFKLPWCSALSTANLPVGSPSRWVMKTSNGLLVLKR